jgi:hypothetical protein
MSQQKYLNGIFANLKEGKFGEFISIGITDEGIAALQALPKNGDFRNWELSPQQKDPSKYSAKPGYVKPNGGTTGGQEDNSSSLPF